MWHKLRDGTKDLGVFWTRLESWASPGVPDLHCRRQEFLDRIESPQVKVVKENTITTPPDRLANKICYRIRASLELG